MATRTLHLNNQAITDAMCLEGIDSNSELARRTGIDRAHLGRIRSGKRPVQPSQVRALAKALRVAPLTLLTPDPREIDAIFAEVAS